MFGPDMCGSTKRTHVIFNYPAKDENLEAVKEIKCETDQKSHLYTLHIKADASYEVRYDTIRYATLRHAQPRPSIDRLID